MKAKIILILFLFGHITASNTHLRGVGLSQSRRALQEEQSDLGAGVPQSSDLFSTTPFGTSVLLLPYPSTEASIAPPLAQPSLLGYGSFGSETITQEAKPETVSDECPESSTAGVCSLLATSPVSCGPNQCQYPNLCAGFGSGLGNCEPVVIDIVENEESPVNEPLCPESDQICITLFEPVVCGDNACEYGNICFAEGAGFVQDNCEDISEGESILECPIINFVQPCSDEPAPVVCGLLLCEYDALCTAEAADFIEDECFLINELDITRPNTDLVLPDGGKDGDTCLRAEPKEPCDGGPPLLCDDCFYENICFAEAAGILALDCEPLEEDGDEVIDECTRVGLTEPCEGGPPVLCSGCDYENICFAEAAGLSEVDCEVINGDAIAVDPLREPEVCPEPGMVPCTRIFLPVTCTGGCEYSNQCVANSAGFGEDECVLAPPEATTTEPKDPNESEITRTEDPTETEASDVRTPIPCPGLSPYIPCNRRYAPVTCRLGEVEDGAQLCGYSNMCQAMGAGFNPRNCFREE